MSRFEQKRVQVRPSGGGELELPCLWIPRSGGKVLAIWRTGAAPREALVVSDGRTYVVESLAPVDKVTDRATLAPVDEVTEEAAPAALQNRPKDSAEGPG